MIESHDLSALKQKHESLLSDLANEMSSPASPFYADSKRLELVQKVTDLVKEIGEKAPFVAESKDFLWLNEAVNTWHLKCARFLDHNLYVPILTPPEQFRVKKLTISEIDAISKLKADQISVVRRRLKATWAARRVFDEYSKEETDWDLYHAIHYIATDILYGRGEEWRRLDPDFKDPRDVWRYLTEETFVWMEDVWLSDVLELRAYEIWEAETVKEKKRVFPSTTEEAESDIARARAEFRGMLLEKKSVSDEARKALVEFVRTRYLVPEDGALDTNKNEVKELIKDKQDRIIALRQDANPVKARVRADKYVRLFYENIVDAVLDAEDANKKDAGAEAKKTIVQAFVNSENMNSEEVADRPSIANCLEAAILRYYVSGLDIIFSEIGEKTTRIVDGKTPKEV